jgi:hypothetical protein
MSARTKASTSSSSCALPTVSQLGPAVHNPCIHVGRDPGGFCIVIVGGKANRLSRANLVWKFCEAQCFAAFE